MGTARDHCKVRPPTIFACEPRMTGSNVRYYCRRTRLRMCVFTRPERMVEM